MPLARLRRSFDIFATENTEDIQSTPSKAVE